MRRRKQRRLLDSLSGVTFKTEPRQPRRPAGRERAPRIEEIEVADPTMCVRRIGREHYAVTWAGRTYDVERGRIEERVGGRWRRNLIRWLVGYVQGVRTAFLLGFVRAVPEWDGIHIWLDELIRRAGLDFIAELFRLFEFKLARV